MVTRKVKLNGYGRYDGMWMMLCGSIVAYVIVASSSCRYVVVSLALTPKWFIVLRFMFEGLYTTHQFVE